MTDCQRVMASSAHWGNVHSDKVLLNHEELWAEGSSPRVVPDVNHLLPELRQMLAEGRYEEANGGVLAILSLSFHNVGEQGFPALAGSRDP